MGNLNLTAITDQTPYVQKIKGALERVSGQSIPLTEGKKVQRYIAALYCKVYQLIDFSDLEQT